MLGKKLSVTLAIAAALGCGSSVNAQEVNINVGTPAATIAAPATCAPLGATSACPALKVEECKPWFDISVLGAGLSLGCDDDKELKTTTQSAVICPTASTGLQTINLARTITKPASACPALKVGKPAFKLDLLFMNLFKAGTVNPDDDAR